MLIILNHFLLPEICMFGIAESFIKTVGDERNAVVRVILMRNKIYYAAIRSFCIVK